MNKPPDRPEPGGGRTAGDVYPDDVPEVIHEEHRLEEEEEYEVSTEPQVAAFERDPEFQELKRRHRSFVFPMTVVFMVYYMALIVGAGYWKGFFDKEVYGVVNVAYLFALSNIFMTFLVAWLYTRYASNRLDPLAEDIKRRLAEKGGRA